MIVFAAVGEAEFAVVDGVPLGHLAEAGDEGGFLDAGGVAAEVEEAAWGGGRTRLVRVVP